MDIALITVGKVKDAALSARIADYVERISHDARIECKLVRDEGDKGREGGRIIETIDSLSRKSPSLVVALSEEGRSLSSVEFSRMIGGANKRVVFVVGGPFGLSDAVKTRADTLLSLSRMTFPHEMARLMVAEQVYRALSILKNRKYHKE
jgi:23S rRNA (pseudouridine1915-N3)-methyltransferase